MIVAWHVAHGFVVIPKSVHRDRIQANAAGARIELTADEVAGSTVSAAEDRHAQIVLRIVRRRGRPLEAALIGVQTMSTYPVTPTCILDDITTAK